MHACGFDLFSISVSVIDGAIIIIVMTKLIIYSDGFSIIQFVTKFINVFIHTQYSTTTVLFCSKNANKYKKW